MAKYLSESPEETREIGRNLGRQLSRGDIVGLIGELGSGKTVLAQGICQGLEVREAVKSPSFIIITQYEGDIPVYHFDLFRIRSDKELLELGYEDYFYGDGVTIVEWAEKAMGLLPPKRVEVRLSILDENSRQIEIADTGKRITLANLRKHATKPERSL